LTDATNSGPKDDTVTNVRKPTLTGTTQPGNTVSIKSPDGTTSPAQVDPQGNWTWTPTSDLAEGDNPIVATASNSAGTTVRNVSVGIYSTPWGASLTDNLDAIEKGTGDVKPGDSKLNIAEFASGLTATFTLAREPSRPLTADDLLITGDAQIKAGSQLTKIDNKTYTAVLEAKAANNAGSFSVKLTDGLTNSASFTDLAGNNFTGVSPALTRSFDTVRPAMALARSWSDTNSDGNISSSESAAGISYSATFSEALSSPLGLSDFSVTNGTVRANSFVINSQTNSYSFVVDPTPSSTGQLQVKVNAASATSIKDIAGNPLDPAALTTDKLQFAGVPFDLRGPTLTVGLTDPTNSGPKNDTVTNVRKPTLTGTTQPGNAVTVKGPDGTTSPAQVDAQGNWTWTPAADLPEGNQPIQVIASNSTGIVIRDVTVGIFNSTWAATLADNLDALEKGTGNVKAGDSKLNITEFASGLTATITLARQPSRELVVDDFQLTGDAQIKANSLLKTSATSYTVVLEAKAANNNGSLSLKLKDSLNNTDTFTDLAGNKFTGSPTALSRNFDTQRPATTLTRSWDETNKDNVLSISENTAGISYSLSFNEALGVAPTVSDFTVTNGTIRANSFAVNSQTNSYSFVVDPTPSSTGQLQVQLKAAAADLLRDVAGNPLDPASLLSSALQFAPASFDLQGPSLSAGLAEASNTGPKDDTVTSTRKPTLSGSTDPGNTVTLKPAGGNTSSPAQVDSQGNWTWTPSADLSEGPQSFTATAIDPAGNSSTRNVDLTLIDASTWAATLADNLDALEKGTGKVKAGDSKLNIAEFANGLTATITLARQPSRDLTADDVQVTGDAQMKANSLVKTSATSYTVVLEAKAANNSGSLSFKLKDSLNNTDTFTDLAGNKFTGSPTALSRNFDTQSPTTTLSRSWADTASDSVLSISENTAGISYSLSFNEALGVAPTVSDFTITNGTIRANSFATNSQTNSYSFVVDPTPSSSGQVQVQLKAAAADLLRDVAGNPLDPASLLSSALQFAPASFDLQAPSLSAGLAEASNTGPKNDTVTSTRKPTLSGSTDPGNTVTIKPTGSSTSSPAQVDSNGNWTWTPSADLSEGPQSFTATAVDPAGNSVTRNVDLTIIYTSTWAATLTDNLSTLEAGTGNVKAGDSKLNIAEFADGLTATITLARDPSRALSLNDLTVSGAARFKNGSFKVVDAQNYTVVLEQSDSSNSGSFTLGLLTPADLTDKAGNTFTGANPALTRSYDTVRPKMSSLSGSWTDTKADSVVNLAESASGITYTARLDEALDADLTLSNFSVTGGTARASSFSKNAQDNSYSFIVDPTPNATGQVQVQLKSTPVIKDVAGNPLDPASTTSAANISYDLVPPALTVGNPVGSTQTIAGNADALVPYSVSGQSSLTASILGQSLVADATGIKLPAANVNNLAEGYYTITVTATDTAGNTSVAYQVLKLNRNTLADDFWTTGSTPPAGDTNNQLYINRAGSQTFTGGGGADTYFWLKKDAGIAGQASVDTITDFSLGGGGNRDVINIADLLGTATGNSLANLGGFIRAQAWDSDGNGINESTRLLISSLGSFQAGQTDTAAFNAADQVILLQGLQTTVDTLDNNNQLVWKAFWA